MDNSTSHSKQSTASATSCTGCRHIDACPIAQPVPEESRDCGSVVQRRYPVPAGQSLFRRGEKFSAVFLVCNGGVKTERVTPEGNQLVTGFHLAGQVVGLEALGDTEYPCDARTLTPSWICKLDFDRLLRMCSDKPEIQSWIISKIGIYARKKDQDLSWSMGMGCSQRILRFFLELHEQLTDGDADRRKEIVLPMKKQDIARYLHISPETLSRNLTELRKENLLQVSNNQFWIPDLGRVQQLTQL